jgi:hypothetical protein
LIEHLLGQGADQGLALEGAVEVPFGALEDVVDMEGAFGGEEYVIYDIHIRLTFGAGTEGGALFGAAEGAQGAELSQGAVFEDFNEVVLG